MRADVGGKTYTLDWNCLIEVEEARSQAGAVVELVSAHRCHACNVALLATSASENTRSSVFPGTASLFRERVEALGFVDLPVVLAPCVMNLSYIGWSFLVDEAEYETLVPSLWHAIFPNFDPDPRSHLSSNLELSEKSVQLPELADWRNHWCDVMSAYSHLHAKRDVFVTLNTRDFQKNADKLAKLGMTDIKTPNECVLDC